jgi:hypothetical protein
MKLENNWRDKTLENLEKSDWGESVNAPTNLVKRCQELRKVPLNNFTIEDLRMMIGQQIGLQYLVQLAIEKLSDDLFAEGDLFSGDLLKSVLNVDSALWIKNKIFGQKYELIKARRHELAEKKIPVAKFDAVSGILHYQMSISS